MSSWTHTELATIANANELQIASRRRDGTLSPPVTIWAVRLNDEIYVRSVHGPGATWYRNLQTRPTGRIWSGSVERDVRFDPSDGQFDDLIDEAYRDKFGSSSTATQRIIAPLARQTTVRLTPDTPA